MLPGVTRQITERCPELGLHVLCMDPGEKGVFEKHSIPDIDLRATTCHINSMWQGDIAQRKLFLSNDWVPRFLLGYTPCFLPLPGDSGDLVSIWRCRMTEWGPYVETRVDWEWWAPSSSDSSVYLDSGSSSSMSDPPNRSSSSSSSDSGSNSGSSGKSSMSDLDMLEDSREILGGREGEEYDGELYLLRGCFSARRDILSLRIICLGADGRVMLIM